MPCRPDHEQRFLASQLAVEQARATELQDRTEASARREARAAERLEEAEGLLLQALARAQPQPPQQANGHPQQANGRHQHQSHQSQDVYATG